ncbi:MAG TPA: saccharopine dehydrogenase NADP-binding domain-containing protein [Hyphomicrobiaceae bacterium]|nr:saccharopine dehydrogenase NADP-binding domain-containing protein [Hyphomicrobiaceae bacterium]
MQRVLVLGGYGAFGGLAAERLARVAGIEVIVAGRSGARAESFAARLAGQAKARISAARLDARDIGAAALRAIGPEVLINATGPFQEQDYRVARACIGAGVHYLDLADARTFVTGIATLDADARQARVLVVSGASTVPAISGAVVDAYAAQFGRPDTVDTTIAPANSFDPGLATTRSILGTLGRPLGGAGKAAGGRIHVWQGLQRRELPGLGGRWLSRCDVPDLELLPVRYPGLDDVRVYAALEVGAFHLGLWGLSWLARAGLLRRPERLAGPLLAVKRRLAFLGSDRGGMTVILEGRDEDGRPRRLTWHLVAGSDHGPYIPATPAVMVARKLLSGELARRGAMPCLGLFTLDELVEEIADLDISAGTA